MIMKMSKEEDAKLGMEQHFDPCAACVCITNIVLLCVTAIVVTVISGEYQVKTYNAMHANLRGITYG